MVENQNNYFLPELLTICGARRNVGKTFLGENIIKYFSKNTSLIAIKISKFQHTTLQDDSMELVHQSNKYCIWKQLLSTEKDSGRYLKAGASDVFYAECSDDYLLEVLMFIKDHYGQNKLLLCESASITKYVQPAVSIFVESVQFKTALNKRDCLNRASLVLQERSIEISQPQLFLSFKNKAWISKYARKAVGFL